MGKWKETSETKTKSKNEFFEVLNSLDLPSKSKFKSEKVKKDDDFSKIFESIDERPPSPKKDYNKEFPQLITTTLPEISDTLKWSEIIKKKKEIKKEEEKQFIINYSNVYKLKNDFKIEVPEKIIIPSIPLCAKLLFPEYFNEKKFKEIYLSYLSELDK